MRLFLALLSARLVRFLLRVTHHGGGTALPGRIALSICPDLLRRLSAPVKTILVTGTNGKTTTCRMVEQLMQEAGVSYFANRGGANLLQGIVTEFAMHASLFGRIRENYAVIECDEGVIPQVSLYTDPTAILVTNIFADQADRFGDVRNTLSAIRSGLRNAPHALVCLNADCSLCASLAEEAPERTVFFGMETPLYRRPAQERSDAAHCPDCGTAYTYELRTYGHLGDWRCPNCGRARPEASVAVTGILTRDMDAFRVTMRIGQDSFETGVRIPGGYNLYNAASTAALGLALGFPAEAAVRALDYFRCGFGRMEKLDLNGHPARMILVKNPAGCNQALNFLADLDEPYQLVLCLNDHTGDGTDPGWIWDVNFETLTEPDSRPAFVYCSGIRSAELALRLQYAGFDMDALRIEDDYNTIIQAMLERPEPIVILPSYTAMMDFRRQLSTSFGLRAFWE
ncbi:MAG: MurT ligase domain-containing protein [Eubacteriales bacterium]|nr:MurT ligase domain-containing protein [Eubacteriales bacterium]